MSVNSGNCPHCGRRRGACWAMPCLDLEIIKERGVRALQQWAGSNFIVKLNHPAKGGRVHAS